MAAIYKCRKCGTEFPHPIGLCQTCEDLGYWIDPAGGLHYDDPDSEDFEDPAAMYE